MTIVTVIIKICSSLSNVEIAQIRYNLPLLLPTLQTVHKFIIYYLVF